MTTTPIAKDIADARPAFPGNDTLQDILRQALKGKEGQIRLVDAGLIELNHAQATLGAVIDSIEGTSEEGTDRHLALWAASCAIKNACLLIDTAITRPAGSGGAL